MRTKLLIAVAALALTVAVFGPFGAADAQQEQNSFTVVKVVDGPVPAGSVFEVEVTCTSKESSPAEGFGSTTMQFDENGDPIGANTITGGPFTNCTATETVTNGASVTYACSATFPSGSPGAPEGAPAVCLDDQTVSFDNIGGAEGTITVTNTFAEPPPPPPPVVDDDDDVVDDGVVTATPPFTG